MTLYKGPHMRLKKTRLSSQRRALDVRLNSWLAPREQSVPRAGWLKAVRESLGLTTRQLAMLMGTNFQNVQRMEEREKKGAVRLASLEKAARAMSCRLVYAIVPEKPHSSLEDIVTSKARELANELVGPVKHSMQLEEQSVSEEDTAAQFRTLVDELTRTLDSRIWRART
jgi:predicted DNA-binding mobile mystery protein A